MFKKKILASLFSIALIMGLVPSVALAADPIATDVVIHAMKVEQSTQLGSNSGKEITEFSGTNLEDAQPLAGVTFKYWKVADTATEAQLSAIKGITTIEQANQYAAENSGILTNAAETAATNATGQVSVSSLAKGIYFFAELNGASNNVAGYLGVPFMLELPAMKTDGTGYFGTGAEALHVYPKNVIETPGLDLETRSDFEPKGERIGGSSFVISSKDAEGNYVPVGSIGTGGTISLPNGIVTLTDLPAGEYRLVNTVAPDGYLVDDRPIDFSVSSGTVTYDTSSNPNAVFTNKNGDTNAKIVQKLAEKPVPEKSVNGTQSASKIIGDETIWTVNIPVPANISEYTSFAMKDTLCEQLSWGGTDSKGDVVIKDKSAGDVPASAYTKSVEGQVLTLTFNPAGLTDYAGETLTITYKTYINSKAGMGEDLKNDVALSFNNGHGGTGETKPETPPSVWSGGAKFKKVDGVSEAPLQGAEFKIATDNQGTTFLKWNAELIEANTSGSFKTPAVGEDIVMVSNATGDFEIKGLAGGDYFLVEIKAPNVGGTQYNLLQEPAQFTIDKVSYQAGKELNVENNSGLQIPQTGGIGTVIFIVAGVSLMGLAVFLFRKKRSRE